MCINSEISNKRELKDFDENKAVAHEGGGIAGNARKEIESETGKKVITSENAKKLHLASKDKKKLN